MKEFELPPSAAASRPVKTWYLSQAMHVASTWLPTSPHLTLVARQSLFFPKGSITSELNERSRGSGIRVEPSWCHNSRRPRHGVRGAMTRNSVIIGLSLALVAVEAGERGGTLSAGQRALELGRRVITLQFSNMPPGNVMLLESGAIAVSDPAELSSFLHELRYVADEPTRSGSAQRHQDALIPGNWASPP